MPGTDNDVERPNIDVSNILELQNHNSGTMQCTEIADHSLESLEYNKDRTEAKLFLWQGITTENDIIHLNIVKGSL